MRVNYLWACPHCEDVETGSSCLMVTDLAEVHLECLHEIYFEDLDSPLKIKKADFIR